MYGPWKNVLILGNEYQYNGIEYLNDFELDLNIATYRVLGPSMGRWVSVDTDAEKFYSYSPFNSMGGNPIPNVDPEGDIFYALPKISFSGGFSLGLEVGVGVPGVASAGIGGSFNLSNGSGSAYIQGTYSGTYAGVGTDGAYAGVGFNAGYFNYGASVSSSGGLSVNAGIGDAFGASTIGFGAAYSNGIIAWSGTVSAYHSFYLLSDSKRYLNSIANADPRTVYTEASLTHSRPDVDGYISLDEAKYWYQNGNGEPLCADFSKIDFRGVNESDFDGVGSKEWINLFFRVGRDGNTYGTLNLEYLGNNTVRSGNGYDVYDFDIQKGRFFRNLFTRVGKAYNGKGVGFKINFYGEGKIGRSSPFFPKYKNPRRGRK